MRCFSPPTRFITFLFLVLSGCACPCVHAEESSRVDGREDPKTVLPLTLNEMNRQIFELSGDRFFPVHKRGRIMMILYDLDRNGYDDAFILSVDAKSREDASFSRLSDFSRLFKEGETPVDFFLSVFLQTKGKLVWMYRIPIGRKVVLDRFEPLTLVKGKVFPFGVSAVFQTPEGFEKEWVIFSNYNKFSFFTVKETLSVHSITYDVDGDGVLDVVIAEQGFEDGTGYETYLTWYRWNGKEFKEWKSTNIVRNLTRYLADLEGKIIAGDYAALSSLMVLPEERRVMHEKGLSDFQIFTSLLDVVNGTDPATVFDEMKKRKIVKVVFPEILENPFNANDTGDWVFPLTMRFVCEDGSECLFTAKIVMQKNPFSERQFFFESYR
ncbi:MAG TPA: VCBS repeat-containing protein [Spirochaetia bacterium]|nr:VCBS repeat-containing protein [Spirochaetia bacterium]